MVAEAVRESSIWALIDCFISYDNFDGVVISKDKPADMARWAVDILQFLLHSQVPDNTL